MPGLTGAGTFSWFFGSQNFFSLPSNTVLTASRDLYDGGDHLLDANHRISLNNYRLFIRGTLTIDSTNSDDEGIVRCNGTDATGQQGAVLAAGFFNGSGKGGNGGVGAVTGGGQAPQVGANSGYSEAGGGGSGGPGTVGAGAAGGTCGKPDYMGPIMFHDPFMAWTGLGITPFAQAAAQGTFQYPSGGAGGGGGSYANGPANASVNGGGGGSGGGIVFVFAREIVLVGDKPHFSVHGGRGGDASGAGSTGGGGGGGGGGGMVVLVASRITGTPATNLAGGLGGLNKGGGTGTSGLVGKLIQIEL